MQKRRRIKHIASFEDRLAYQAYRLRDQAKELRPGLRREELLRKARQAETAAHISEWLKSPAWCRRSERPWPAIIFNFRSAQNMVLDDNGLDFPNLRAARKEALAFVREAFAKASETGSVSQPYRIIITEAAGRKVATIASEDVFQG